MRVATKLGLLVAALALGIATTLDGRYDGRTLLAIVLVVAAISISPARGITKGSTK